MIDVLRLVRFSNLLIAAAGVVAGGWIALGTLGWSGLLGWAAVSGIGLGAAGNALNDLFDLPADTVNRARQRPLALGRLSRGTAELCICAGVVLGLGAAGFVNGRLVFVGVAALAVMTAYSPVLKRRGWPGNLAVACVAGLPLFYGAVAVGRPRAGLVPWFLAAWLHLVREIVKDVEDEAGDRVAGRRTLPIVLGRARAVRGALWLALVFVPLSIALPWAMGYEDRYFAFAAVAQLIVVLAALRLRHGGVAGVSVLLKGGMVAGLVALVAGRVT